MAYAKEETFKSLETHRAPFVSRTVRTVCIGLRSRSFVTACLCLFLPVFIIIVCFTVLIVIEVQNMRSCGLSCIQVTSLNVETLEDLSGGIPISGQLAGSDNRLSERDYFFVRLNGIKGAISYRDLPLASFGGQLSFTKDGNSSEGNLKSYDYSMTIRIQDVDNLLNVANRFLLSEALEVEMRIQPSFEIVAIRDILHFPIAFVRYTSKAACLYDWDYYKCFTGDKPREQDGNGSLLIFDESYEDQNSLSFEVDHVSFSCDDEESLSLQQTCDLSVEIIMKNLFQNLMVEVPSMIFQLWTAPRSLEAKDAADYVTQSRSKASGLLTSEKLQVNTSSESRDQRAVLNLSLGSYDGGEINDDQIVGLRRLVTDYLNDMESIILLRSSSRIENPLLGTDKDDADAAELSNTPLVFSTSVLHKRHSLEPVPAQRTNDSMVMSKETREFPSRQNSTIASVIEKVPCFDGNSIQVLAVEIDHIEDSVIHAFATVRMNAPFNLEGYLPFMSFDLRVEGVEFFEISTSGTYMMSPRSNVEDTTRRWNVEAQMGDEDCLDPFLNTVSPLVVLPIAVRSLRNDFLAEDILQGATLSESDLEVGASFRYGTTSSQFSLVTTLLNGYSYKFRHPTQIPSISSRLQGTEGDFRVSFEATDDGLHRFSLRANLAPYSFSPFVVSSSNLSLEAIMNEAKAGEIHIGAFQFVQGAQEGMNYLDVELISKEEQEMDSLQELIKSMNENTGSSIVARGNTTASGSRLDSFSYRQTLLEACERDIQFFCITQWNSWRDCRRIETDNSNGATLSHQYSESRCIMDDEFLGIMDCLRKNSATVSNGCYEVIDDKKEADVDLKDALKIASRFLSLSSALPYVSETDDRFPISAVGEVDDGSARAAIQSQNDTRTPIDLLSLKSISFLGGDTFASDIVLPCIFGRSYCSDKTNEEAGVTDLSVALTLQLKSDEEKQRFRSFVDIQQDSGLRLFCCENNLTEVATLFFDEIYISSDEYQDVFVKIVFGEREVLTWALKDFLDREVPVIGVSAVNSSANPFLPIATTILKIPITNPFFEKTVLNLELLEPTFCADSWTLISSRKEEVSFEIDIDLIFFPVLIEFPSSSIQIMYEDVILGEILPADTSNLVLSPSEFTSVLHLTLFETDADTFDCPFDFVDRESTCALTDALQRFTARGMDGSLTLELNLRFQSALGYEILTAIEFEFLRDIQLIDFRKDCTFRNFVSEYTMLGLETFTTSLDIWNGVDIIYKADILNIFNFNTRLEGIYADVILTDEDGYIFKGRRPTIYDPTTDGFIEPVNEDFVRDGSDAIYEYYDAQLLHISRISAEFVNTRLIGGQEVESPRMRADIFRFYDPDKILRILDELIVHQRFCVVLRNLKVPISIQKDEEEPFQLDLVIFQDTKAVIGKCSSFPFPEFE